MDSGAQPDRLSELPDVLLVLIMSFLSFKQRAQTSLLAKRWRPLYLETRDLSFKESDFLPPSAYANPIRWVRARVAFVDYVCRWVDRVHDGQPIDAFGISISYPQTYLEVIESLIAFAVRKRVKSLVLDFSNPAWRSYKSIHFGELVVKIPQSVYDLTSLESLEVCACEDFDPSKLAKLGNLRRVSLGWMELTEVLPFLEKLKIESLTMNECWVLDFERISSEHIREVVINNTDFYLSVIFDLPKVDILRYKGDLNNFEFDRMNSVISEVEFDFGGSDNKPGESYDSYVTEGEIICTLFNKLLDGGGRTATTLTVGPFILKAIPRAEHPLHHLLPMKTKHLVLKTKLDPLEFNGIRFLLINCPDLETLTVDLLPPNPNAMASSYARIDPQTYWMQNMSYKCVREALTTVVVKNFVGGATEVNMVKSLLRSGGERLERVELHMPFNLDESRKTFASAKSEMLQRSSKNVEFIVHNA